MKRVFFLTPFALAAMAGCAPAPDQIQAGQWEIVTELRSVDMPGAPAEVQQQIRSQIGRPDSAPGCLGPEQVRTFLQVTRQLLTQGQAANCTFTDETYAAGSMTQHASCPGPAGQPANTISFNGHFSRTTFNGTVNVERPTPRGPVRFMATLRGRRLGDCPATAAGPPGAPQPEL